MVARFALELSSDGHSPFTVREYMAIIRRWQQSGLSPVEYLAAINVRPSTRALRARVLKLYLSWAADHGGGRNPLADMHFRAVPPNGERPFSGAEIERLFAACRTPFEHGVIMCLLTLGVRASELASVKTEDMEEDTVRIHGKGNKYRLLALSPVIKAELEAVIARHPAYQSVYRTVRDIGKRAGVPNCHPHRFRHSFAHVWLERGGDVGSLQSLLGHSTIGQSLYYASFLQVERAVAAHRRFLQG